jgi:proteasome accessory factor C
MNDRLSSFIRMLPWLVARPHVSIQEFRAEFGLTKKQAIQALNTLTFVGPDQGGGGLVDIEFDGEFIFVRNAQNFDRPVRLNRLEATSLLGGLTYLRAIAVTENVARIDDLIAKISNAAESTGTPIEIVPNQARPSDVATLRRAIQENRRLDMEYSNGVGGVSRRVIEPHCIEALNDVLYVAAWCQKAGNVRTFRIDRIMGLSDTDAPSTNHDGITAEVEVVGSVHATVLTTIEALEDFSSVHILSQVQQSDGRWLVELKVGSLNWLAGLILANGGEIEALEPADLRTQVLERANKWLESNGHS